MNIEIVGIHRPHNLLSHFLLVILNIIVNQTTLFKLLICLFLYDQKMFDKYIEYAERFESLFLGTKSNPNLIKNQIPGLLALYILPRIFFLLVHHIIKIEEKKSCNIWPKIGQRYLFTFHIHKSFSSIHRIDYQIGCLSI